MLMVKYHIWMKEYQIDICNRVKECVTVEYHSDQVREGTSGEGVT